jgi:peptide/nickel transport system ATP-binding protein
VSAAGTARRILRTPGGAVGSVVLLLLLIIAFLGPLFAPHSLSDIVGLPSEGPSSSFPLGTDYLGRDVLSRLLDGGRSVILIGFTSTVIAYLVGGVIGVYAGYHGGFGGTVAMRAVDLLLTIPSILFLLLMASGLGQHVWVLVVGVVIIQFPGISRVIRTATASVAKLAYVEAAQSRGERTSSIWRRDIVPNILPNLLADFGIRFSVSILLVASMNYLGLGLTPPTADWGLMTSENQATISLNALAVVAPALMLALLCVSINLIADSYTRTLGRSGTALGRRQRRARRLTPAADVVAETLEHAPVPEPGSNALDDLVDLTKQRGDDAAAAVVGPPAADVDEAAGNGAVVAARRQHRAARATIVRKSSRRTAREDADALLVLDDLCVETNAGQIIVDDVGLRLGAGEILGLVGESGSGKTTTALSLFGFAQGGVRLVRGTVRVGEDGPFNLTNAATLSRLRGRDLAYVPQSPGTSLNPGRRIEAALREMQVYRDRGSSRSAGEAAAERARILGIVGLPADREFQRRFPHQLSGGQQQRVCIAIALLSGAKVLVLDEPTTGLDVITQALILDELRRLRRDLGASMIYISHDLAVVAQLATHVAVMYAGKLVEIGSTDEVIGNPAHPYTRGLLQSTPDHRSSTLVKAMPGVAVSLAERTGDFCPFWPRCARATDVCRTEEPDLVELQTPGHLASCFHPDQAKIVLEHRSTTVSQERPDTTVLQVEHLSVEHRVRGVRVAAVDDVSFSVRRGECVAIVGESGSGKTTMARAITGLQHYGNGSIELHGEPLAQSAAQRSAEQRRRIQIVFQNATAALNPRENVRSAINRALRLCPADRRKTVPELMELVRLSPSLAESFPGELSGGERQRIGIARALATDCELLVCDEVTSALDVSVQAAVLTLLRDLRQTLGLSLLFITHDLGVVANLADEVLVLERGVICEYGPTRGVLDQPHSDYAKKLMDAAPVVDSSR